MSLKHKKLNPITVCNCEHPDHHQYLVVGSLEDHHLVFRIWNMNLSLNLTNYVPRRSLAETASNTHKHHKQKY
ncbi:CLUMA_CG001564, isoform A [Clunio marinus]|uniref:CLUMA_CG001564, isoform A n=1 Tax=Clunio marinus TaxID=568069 RepID=A0A1J1HIN2_9DIPT|nr:CLUMA_CG001564, isoform A [Clunio marinus]